MKIDMTNRDLLRYYFSGAFLGNVRIFVYFDVGKCWNK